MPFNLPLPIPLRQARWKVKIREKESREPPHATLLQGTQAWRIDLRTSKFMDPQPDPSLVPEDLLAHIKAVTNWRRLCDEWDRKYPNNPIGGQADAGEE